jgi:hypothetical protein
MYGLGVHIPPAEETVMRAGKELVKQMSALEKGEKEHV